MDRVIMLDMLLKVPQWDFIVIGGGASGLGVALDAASRGYRTLLLEQGDFAQGTSSRSTKLIHGGIRYLSQGRITFVRKALQERGILFQNAPHLIHPRQFILPCRGWRDFCYYSVGVKLYDLLAGGYRLSASSSLSKAKMNRLIPSLTGSSFTGGICYTDAQFDDARLAINLAQTIADRGGCVLNYTRVQSLLKSNGKLSGVIVKDLENLREYELLGKIVINATGAAIETVCKMDDPKSDSFLVLSQGAHVVLNRSFFPSDFALLIPNHDDGRILFIIPWYHRILIGTTDTQLDVNPIEPVPKEEEIRYLFEHTLKYLTKTPQLSDICSAFAGVRALVKPKRQTSNLSKIGREHEIMVSSTQLVTLAGGKWTTYRQLGEETVNIAAKIAGLEARPSQTRQMRIHGWSAQHLERSDWDYYGSDLPLVNQLAGGTSSNLEKLHPDLPCRRVDIQWAVRNEMARTVEDVLSRRNRSLILDAKESASIAPHVASIMAKEMGKDHLWEKKQVQFFLRNEFLNEFLN